MFHPISRDEALTLVKSGGVITLRSDVERLTYSEIFALPETVDIVRREPGMLVATTDTVCKLTAAEADQVKGMDRKEQLGFLRAKHNEQRNAVKRGASRRTGRTRSLIETERCQMQRQSGASRVQQRSLIFPSLRGSD